MTDPVPPLLCPELVDRENQLVHVRAVVELRAAQHVVAVVGHAGNGKSALAERALTATPTLVLRGRATPGGARLRLLAEVAVEAVVHGADPRSPMLDPFQFGLDALLPGTGPPQGTSAPAREPVGGSALPLLVAEALLVLLGTVGRPVTVVFEDAHWADSDSVDALERLCDRIATRPISVVLLTRPGSDAELLARRLVSRRAATLVEVAPLGEHAVAEMAHRCLGGAVPPPLLDLLAAASGCPFEVEELLRTAYDCGALHNSPDGWLFDEATVVPPPRTLTASVAMRIGQLPEPAQRALTVAAALGAELPVTVLLAAAQVSEPEWENALREGLRAQLLDPGGSFRHALSAEVAAAQLTPRQLRVAAARALVAGQGVVGDTVLAALALKADEKEAAAHHLWLSARHHAAAGAVAAAVAALVSAVELTGDSSLRAVMRVDLVEQLALAGREREVLELAEVAAADHRTDTSGLVRVDLARARCVSGGALRAAALSRAKEAAAGGPLEAKVSATAALLAIDEGDVVAAQAHAQHAVDLSARDPEARCQALEVLGRVARSRSLEEALGFFIRAAATAEANDLLFWRARALHEKATIVQLRTGSVVELEEARAVAMRAGAPGLVASVDFHIAAVLATCFAAQPALEAARRYLDLATALGNRHQQAWAWLLVAFANTLGCQWRSAQLDVEQAEHLRVPGVELTALYRFYSEGLERLLRADIEGATAGYWRAMSILAQSAGVVAPLPPWHLGPLLATVGDDRGEQARALANRPELLVAAMCEGPWLLAEAVAAGRRGDPAQARRLRERADAVWEQAPGFAAYRHLSQWLVAADAHRDGWGEPRSWLFDAQRWAATQGYTAVADACAAGLRQIGAVPKRIRGGGEVPAGLRRLGVTHREAQVLALLAEGLTNAGIAGRLHVSAGTVKGYVSQLLAKTGASNRAGLARIAAELGTTDRV